MTDETLERDRPLVPHGWNLGRIAVGIALIALVVGASWTGATFNRLVRLDQAVKAQWAQVDNAYQRRADLVPNLVETVKGAAGFEQQTLQAVTEARARVQKSLPDSPSPTQLREYQQNQEQLGAALSRLLVVVESYPQLKATENFRDLQAQVEGTENRIAVERMRFNEAAQQFNTQRDTFPTNVVAGVFGSRFAEKAYFQAREGSSVAPRVKF